MSPSSHLQRLNDVLTRKMKPLPSWLGGALLLVSVFLAYSNSLHGPFIFDDASSIIENPTIRSWKTVLFPPGDSGLTVSGRPVVNVSIALNYWLHGADVTGYHVFNLLIHAASSLLVFGLVGRTLRGRCGFSEGESWWYALVVAALWALHPLQTESVTYVIQRAESLVGFFYLLTMYFFVRVLEEPGRLPWKVATVGACLLGMATKEVMATAPLMVLLFDRAFAAGSFREAWRARRGLYVSLACTWLLLGLCILATGKRGDTVGITADVSAMRYATTQCYAVIHYLRLAFWPDRLVLDYGSPLADSFSDVAFRAPLLFALIAVTVFLWVRNRTAGFIGLAFFLVLAPTSSVVPVLTQTVAEHRMYLAVLSLVILAVWFTRRWLGLGGLILWLVVAALFGVRTYIRNRDYRTAESIWASVTRNSAHNVRGWSALALTYLLDGQPEKALPAADTALRLKPKDPGTLANYADVLAKLNRFEEAEFYYRKALEFEETHFDAKSHLGTLLLEQGKFGTAAEELAQALKLKPESLKIRYNLGKAHVGNGDLARAEAEFRRVLAVAPEADDARNNLGNVLMNQGRLQEAIDLLLAAKGTGSAGADLQRTLALAYLQAGRPAEAAGVLQKLISRDARDARAHANLGLALTAQGRESEAFSEYERALEIGEGLPSDIVRALNVTLGERLLQQGDLARARTCFERAVAAEPGEPLLRLPLAGVLVRLGDLKAAFEQYQQVVAQVPDAVDGYVGLAWVCELTGQLEQARACVRRALELQPQHPGAREAAKRLGR